MNKNLESRFRSAGLVSTFVETDSDGTTVHCWIPKGRSGNFKPAFVMLHGFGSTTVWQWYKKISELQSFFAIYVSDLLFCGQSFTPKPERTETFQAECVMEVLKSLGVLEFNLPGISYGEFVAFRMAYVFPAAVQRVIISSSGVLMTLEDYVDLASRGHVNVVAELLLPISPEALLEASKLVISRPPKLPHFLLQGFWSVSHSQPPCHSSHARASVPALR